MTNPRPTLEDLGLEPRPGETYPEWSARFDAAANLTHHDQEPPPMPDHHDLTDLLPDDLSDLAAAVLEHGIHPVTGLREAALLDGRPVIVATYTNRPPIHYCLADDGDLLAHELHPGSGAITHRMRDGQPFGPGWETPAGDPARN